MHAGSILFLWVAAVLLVQQAESWSLAVLSAASLTVALGCARIQCMRLLARIRVLLLAILVLFAWFTPGEAVLVDWPRAGPSREGLFLALTHGGRLVALVCWVAILLGRMSADRLVSGLYALVRPCRVFGLPTERIALRLLLVLRHASAACHGEQPRRDWKTWLNLPAATALDAVQLKRERLGVRDIVLPLGVYLLMVFWWLR
ncbi:MAG: energy-coupling factor transporter transmembrane protein EcfT [Azoarcus sp.]|jgi:energy-coupling factor transporter transmembrane protein EcfT|nr:energy-coupling factor transporter transmembrane protein EcfT [Azoarcus sp.]